MQTLTQVLVGMIALLHFWFMAMEMFLWCKPIGLKTFHMDQATANATAVLAGNQGLYNGFLAAGLLWGVLCGDTMLGFAVKMFFLACVFVAGVYGGLTTFKKILLIQALPALIGLLLVYLSRS